MFYIILIVLLLSGGAMAILVFQNFTPEVEYTLFFWHMPAMPLGLLLLLSFLSGAFLLYIVGLGSAWQDQRELKKLQKRIAQLEELVSENQADAGQLPLPDMFVPMPGMPPQQ